MFSWLSTPLKKIEQLRIGSNSNTTRVFSWLSAMRTPFWCLSLNNILIYSSFFSRELSAMKTPFWCLSLNNNDNYFKIKHHNTTFTELYWTVTDLPLIRDRPYFQSCARHPLQSWMLTLSFPKSLCSRPRCRLEGEHKIQNSSNFEMGVQGAIPDLTNFDIVGFDGPLLIYSSFFSRELTAMKTPL